MRKPRATWPEAFRLSARTFLHSRVSPTCVLLLIGAVRRLT